MQTQVRGMVILDIVASASFAPRDLEGLMRALSETMRGVTRPDVQTLHTGDGGVLVFPTPGRSYEGLKTLVSAWINAKDGFTSPLVSGIRLALHTGALKTLERHDGAIVGSPLIMAARLMSAAPPDTVALSVEAFDLLKDAIAADGFQVSRETLSGKRGIVGDAYIIAIRDLFNPSQYLVRIEPPTDLLLYLASHPEQLYAITPRKFEEVVAELLADFGYEVELTKQTRDNGIDIIAISRDVGLGLVEKYLVQCKRNAPKNKVGIGVVHEILGVGVEEPSTGLVIATTSTFTQPARALVRKESVRWRLHLKDYDEIREWLSAYSGKRIKT